MSTDTLRHFMGGGVSVIVGTVDADGIPSCCRGIAVTTRDDFATITVYVPAATAQETIANVATTRRVAVSITHPLSHESLQIKGVSHGVRLAPESDEAFVRKRLGELADVLAEVGLPRRVTNSIAHWPAFAVEVSVEQVFNQTPGPKAGTAIA